MERLKHMKEALMCCVENQLNHLEQVDAKELGEAIDMIKDLEEAIYYKTVVDAMKETSEGEGWRKQSYYREKPRRDWEEPKEDWEWNKHGGVMYYDGNGSGAGSHDRWMGDAKDGRSHRSRRMYMEAKEMHADKNAQMRELENYMQELTQDIIEMVEGATSEEKQYLSKRVAALANKLAQIND